MTPLDKNGQYIPSDYDYVETYLEMEKLVNKGLVKSIGVSNFNHRQLERVLERACIVPVINQVKILSFENIYI